MRILLVSFLTFVAIHLSPLLANEENDIIKYTQIVSEDFGGDKHDIRHWRYEIFKSRDVCENDLMRQLKSTSDLEGGKAEFVRGLLVISKYDGLIKLRCVKLIFFHVR